MAARPSETVSMMHVAIKAMAWKDAWFNVPDEEKGRWTPSQRRTFDELRDAVLLLESVIDFKLVGGVVEPGASPQTPPQQGG